MDDRPSDERAAGQQQKTRGGSTGAATSYDEWLKQELGELIEKLDLDEFRKGCLRSRWMDQVAWMEGRAGKAQRWYFNLRLIVVVGAAVVPVLVGLNIGEKVPEGVQWVVFGISLLVAICGAIEGLFHYGDRWRHYRRTVELLKIEGWRYFQLIGPYRRFSKVGDAHARAYPLFADRVEGLIQSSVEEFVELVSEEEEEEEGQEGAGAS